MEWPAYRRYPRIEAFLPAECNVFAPGVPMTCLRGKTRDISPGGAMILLPTCIPQQTRLKIRLGDGPELRSHVAWAGKVLLTDLGTLTGHGVAFTRDLDASGLKEVLSRVQRQRHSRVATRFPVEFSDMEKSGMGTCLNISPTGMFIATTDPISVGQDVLVHVAPPRLMHIFSLWSRVVWMNRFENKNSFPAGFGLRFLKMQPTEASHLTTLLQELQSRSALPVSASSGLDTA